MACCSSCNYTPCSCATITGEADAPQCLPPGSEVALDSVGGFDEFNCPRALNPFRGFDDNGNPITIITTPPNTKAAFLFQNSTGNVSWTDRPKVVLPPRQIGLETPSYPPNASNSIPKLVGVDTTGEWKEIAARTGQTASTVKWNPTTGFTLKPDSNEPSLCTSLTESLTLTAGTSGPYTATVASTDSFTVGLSVVILSKEYLVTALTSTTLTLTASAVPASTVTLPIGTFVCGVGYKPVSGISSPYVDTLTGSLGGASSKLEFSPDAVNGKKVPGLFWRDQLGQVAFLPAPVDSLTGLVTPNLTLKTPAVPTALGANKLEFVPAPGAYTWVTPYEIPLFTFDVGAPSYGGPTTSPRVFNVSTAPGYVAGAKMVVLDCRVMLSLGAGVNSTAIVELTINGLYAGFVQVSTSYGSTTDTTQIIVPIPTSSELTLSTYKATPTINGLYSQKIRVLGFIG